MTESEMKRIERLRRNGNSYRRIAEITGVGLSTIKMHCSRNAIRPQTSEDKVCIVCGKELGERKTGRPALFCSNGCRLRHWRGSNRNKAGSEHKCSYCGKVFKAYVQTRKFCSHECYVKARFGEVFHEA